MNYQLEPVKIYWGRNINSYLYGASWKQLADKKIYFAHRLLPSGVVIQEWNMKTNYQANRQTPKLPLLKQGEQYQLKGYMDISPEKSVYIRIHYYNRYQEEIGFDVLKTNELIFTYPKEAFYYKIQLISAGCQELTFHYLELSPVLEEEEAEDFLSKVYYRSGGKNRTIIFSEPRVNQHHELSPEDVLYFENVHVIPSKETESFSRMSESVYEALHLNLGTFDPSELSFVGYGPISNFLALYFASKWEGTKAYITSAWGTDSFYLDYVSEVLTAEECKELVQDMGQANKKFYDQYVDKNMTDESLFASLIRYENSLLRFHKNDE